MELDQEMREVFARIARLIVRLEYKVVILEQLLIERGVDKQTIQSAFDTADNAPETKGRIQTVYDYLIGRI